MGKPGAKKMDQIVSATPGDVHITIPPAGPPVPVPHPCTSIIKDKVAEKVKVMGQPGAVKGSISKHSPPHFPMGPYTFQKPPTNKGEIFTASSNVLYEGKEAAMLGDTAKMCADPVDAPVGKVIGTAATVLIGGGGKGGGEAGEKTADDALKAVAAKMHAWIEANIACTAAREQAHRAVCSATGHPVDVATGKLFTRNVDFVLPGRIPISFMRNYSSARRDRGIFGHSWRHSYERQLIIQNEFIAHRDENGRFLAFPPLRIGESAINEFTHQRLECRSDGYLLHGPNNMVEFFRFSGEPKKTATVSFVSYIEDFYGNRVRFGYEGDRLVRITDTVGRVLVLDYNDRGLVCALRFLSDGRSESGLIVRRYAYSNDDDLIEWVDEAGHTYRFEYEQHLLTVETDRCGFSFYFAYDAEGWCQHTWGNNGLLQRRLEYDIEKQRTRVIDSDGLTKMYEWNDCGVVERETDHWGNTRSFEYDAALRLVRMEDQVGNVWSKTFDEVGRLIASEDPEGGATEYKYDEMGRVVLHLDALGGVWRYEYSANCLLTTIVNPVGDRRIEHRLANGDLVRIVEADRRETLVQYDFHGNLERITTADGLQISRSYSHRGQLESDSDQLGPRLRIQYDQRGCPTLVWDRHRGERRFRYDKERRIISVVEVNGRTIDYEYGQFDRIVRSVSNPVELFNGTTEHLERQFTYDHENRLVAYTTRGGESIRINYDGHERPMEISYPDGRVQRYERDARGFVVALRENGDLVFEQKLDFMGRVMRRTTGDGEMHTFEYDSKGNLLSAESDGVAGVSCAFVYDKLGRIGQEEGPSGLLCFTSNASLDRYTRSWNDDLELLMRWARGPEGTRQTIARREQDDIELDYDQRARLTRILFPSGERHEMGYEGLNLPSLRTCIPPNGRRVLEKFAYDDQGWLTGHWKEEHCSERYLRDGHNRLVGVVNERHGREQHRTFGFDQHGNRVHTSDLQGASQSCQYDPGHRIKMCGRIRLDHDHRGRVIEISDPELGTTRFNWDSLGQMKSAVLPSGEIVKMRYDAFGRRVQKTSRRGTTYFAWDGERLAHEVRPDGEERHYLYEGTSHRPLACYIRRPGGDWRMHAFTLDLRGAPIRLTGPDGEVVWQQNLDPWGEPTEPGTYFDQPLAMPGQYRDVETDLHYNIMRYYFPKAGSYLTPDPIGFAGGDDSYTYVQDPVCWMDPLGLSGDDYVTVYHGTTDDPSELRDQGFEKGRGTVFVSRDRAAAEDAVKNHPDRTGRGGVVESRVPRADFERVMAPTERPYAGFFNDRKGGYSLMDSNGRPTSTEIPLRTDEAIQLFNDNIVR
jgi:RHS repeat-associated protein